MPTIEYQCQTCRHSFSRLVFRGDEAVAPNCPVCGSNVVSKRHQSESLFDGIAPSSGLAQDRN
jgi:putative FmdB family regulatory protein